MDVCVDASFVLKLALPEPEQAQVRAIWQRWLGENATVIAPVMWQFEAHSAIWRRVVRGNLTDEEGRQAWALLQSLGVEMLHPPDLFDRAWSLATVLHLPATYDATYLALAELRGCDMWTADRRLANAAQGRFPWLHVI